MKKNKSLIFWGAALVVLVALRNRNPVATVKLPTLPQPDITPLPLPGGSANIGLYPQRMRLPQIA